ncbi:hypothetical protein [Nonomuraea indica]|uniref:LppX_LprAFG lipoprotein n=1 Tax=Nonomuraea indica TaxID=1581193 RepID=A0ABW8A1X8_9ACTN
MKHFIAGLACVAGTVLTVPANMTTAQASVVSSSAVDQVNALRQQFRAGRGVRVAETVRLSLRAKRTVTVRRKGTLQFGPSGIVGAHFVRRATVRPPLEKSDPVNVRHMISVGETYYHFDATPADENLPEGKKWVRASAHRPFQKWHAAFGDQDLNVLEPGTLALLLRSAARRLPDQGGVQYGGVIAQAELYKASRSFRDQRFLFEPGGKEGRLKIAWRLWVNRTGLVTRLVTSRGNDGMFHKASSDTRYTGWGSEVTITAPPADQVIDEADVDY